MRRLQKLELEKAFIMALAGSDDDYTVNFLVDDSIEVINSFAPPAGQISLEWFWFSNSVVDIPLYLFDKAIDSF